MAEISETLTLYTAQTPVVRGVLDRDGVCYNQERYIRAKYQEVSEAFLVPYRQFVRQASRILPPPEGAEFPYWAFRDPVDLYVGAGMQVWKLEVPRNEVLLFDMEEWNRMLQHQYLGETDQERAAFQTELDRRGITAWDVMSTGFYPDLRQRVFRSWEGLLRHHQALLDGTCPQVRHVQAALWRFRPEWIVETKEF